MKWFVLISALLSCQKFTQKILSNQYQSQIISQDNADHVQIIFTHNINGELKPCGCRQFPLGGMEQVAGELFFQRQKSPVIFVDIGDTFFYGTHFLESSKESTQFSSQKILEALNMLKIDYHVPGEREFTMGEEHLSSLYQKANFSILLSNASSEFPAQEKIKTFQVLEYAPEKFLILFGALDPRVVAEKNQKFLKPAEPAITQLSKTLLQIKKSKPQSKIIFFSHSGLEQDKVWAKKFPWIDWIVGAHDQSLIQKPLEIGKTKIVQVLSRNHYLGKINFPRGTQSESYEIIEMRDHVSKKIPNNPLTPFIQEFSSKLAVIQQREQEKLFSPVMSGKEKISTFRQCIDCHETQTSFWQQTSHSLAFFTLIKNQADFNTQCIGCHSLGMNEPGGFSGQKDMVMSEQESEKFYSGKVFQYSNKENYWQKLHKLAIQMPSPRNVEPQERVHWHSKLNKLQIAEKIKYDYAHVQCLHCHQQSSQHPFDEKKSTSLSTQEIAQKCIQCHNADQSPSWYQNDQFQISNPIFQNALKQVSCPKSI